MRNETVNGFRNEFFFLSNFYPSLISVSFKNEFFEFPTAEHVFQAMKVKAISSNDDKNSYQDPVELLRQLESSKAPVKAKYWGRKIKINVEYWDSISIKAMRKTLDLKFTQHQHLKDKLIDTNDTKLVEYNSWNDTFWGVNESTGIGENNLGILLMELRESVRNTAYYLPSK